MFQAAVQKYSEIQDSDRGIKLIKAAQNKVSELTKYFESGSDLFERDKQGKPVFIVKNIMAEMSGVSKIVAELDALELMVKKKMKAQSGLRAGAEEGYVPKRFAGAVK